MVERAINAANECLVLHPGLAFAPNSVKRTLLNIQSLKTSQGYYIKYIYIVQHFPTKLCNVTLIINFKIMLFHAVLGMFVSIGQVSKTERNGLHGQGSEKTEKTYHVKMTSIQWRIQRKSK